MRGVPLPGLPEMALCARVEACLPLWRCRIEAKTVGLQRPGAPAGQARPLLQGPQAVGEGRSAAEGGHVPSRQRGQHRYRFFKTYLRNSNETKLASLCFVVTNSSGHITARSPFQPSFLQQVMPEETSISEAGSKTTLEPLVCNKGILENNPEPESESAW